MPLLETADPGEPPQRGGEVYARLGKGHYVYTSYAWFRQLPAGVPGAYRLFANLLSLGGGVARAPVRQALHRRHPDGCATVGALAAARRRPVRAVAALTRPRELATPPTCRAAGRAPGVEP